MSYEYSVATLQAAIRTPTRENRRWMLQTSPTGVNPAERVKTLHFCTATCGDGFW